VRRKRRTKYTWLPIQNGATFGGDADYDRTEQKFVLDVPPDGDVITGIIPVVADLPQGTLTTVESEGIGEIVGNEYILKRIVGKVFCYLDNTNISGDALGVDTLIDTCTIVTAGFFVARADTAVLSQPIGTGAEGNLLYSPQVAANTRQPWIWRRSWILGVDGFGPGLTEDLGVTIPTGSVIRGRGSFPSNNLGYPGVLDGPHVDAKTGRRVRLNERLFFACSASYYTPGGIAPTTWNTNVQVMVDCRYLGALRRPKGRSNFA